MTEWITVKEAARQLSVAERTVRAQIQTGKLKAKRDGRIWLVHSDLKPPTEEETAAEGRPNGSRTDADIIQVLREQLAEKDKQISKLQEESADRSQWQDTIVLQLTRQLEQSQKLLEDKRPKRRRLAFWRRRVFGREEE